MTAGEQPREILGLAPNVFLPFVFGATIIMVVLLVVLSRPEGRTMPHSTMRILRVALSVAAASVAGAFTGLLWATGKAYDFAIQAGGGMAIFVIVFVGLKGWENKEH